MRKLVLAIAAAAVAFPVLPAPALASGYDVKVWRDSEGRHRCKRTDGTTGVLVGRAAEAASGHTIERKGDRATGAILGAAAGALLGRRIERDRARCR